MISNQTIFNTVEDLFQDTMAELQDLHEKKLNLIKSARLKNNQAELSRVRQAII